MSSQTVLMLQPTDRILNIKVTSKVMRVSLADGLAVLPGKANGDTQHLTSICGVDTYVLIFIGGLFFNVGMLGACI